MCAWASRNAAGVVWTEWEPRTRSYLCGTAEPRTNSASVNDSNSTASLDGSKAAKSPCRNSSGTDMVPEAMAVQRTSVARWWLVTPALARLQEHGEIGDRRRNSMTLDTAPERPRRTRAG